MNHSLRATGPTHLYQKGADKKLVRELTGHRSNTVLEYKRTSNEMKENVSQMLYGNTPIQRQSQAVKKKSGDSCSQLFT